MIYFSEKSVDCFYYVPFVIIILKLTHTGLNNPKKGKIIKIAAYLFSILPNSSLASSVTSTMLKLGSMSPKLIEYIFLTQIWFGEYN